MSAFLTKQQSAELRRIVKEIEDIDAERKRLADDIASKYEEARGRDLDVETMRAALGRRRKDRKEVEEQDERLAAYERALRGLDSKTGTDRATRARARDEAEDEAA